MNTLAIILITVLAVLVVVLGIALGVSAFRARRARRRPAAVAPSAPAGPTPPTPTTDLPNRRDVGFGQILRWIQVGVIWLGIIPGVSLVLFLTIVSKYAAAITLNWVVGGIMLSLVISTLVFFTVMEHFILQTGGNRVVGVKKEIGPQPLDDEGFPILGLFFSGVRAKFFWETVVFEMDLSRDVIVTLKDVPDHPKGELLRLETLTGVDMLTAFQFVLRPNLEHLQELFHAGGRDAEKVVDEKTGRTVRDNFLAEVFAGDAAQRLSDLFANRQPEQIRRNKVELCDAWSQQYRDISNRLEETHGVHAGSFKISNTDYDSETANARRQEAVAHYKSRAAGVYLHDIGVTFDEDLLGELNGRFDENGAPLKWRRPTDKEYKEAMDHVHISANEVTRHIDERRIPALEGEGGDNLTLGAKALLFGLLGNNGGSGPGPAKP